MVAFTIRNVSRQPIELWPHELPWGNAYAIDVVAVDTAGRLLERILPIDDPGPAARLRLEPGASRSGFSDLATVQDLDAGLRRSDVIVYWSYKLDLGQPAVTTGVVVLPRRTP